MTTKKSPHKPTRPAAAATRQAARTEDVGPARYRADIYHEIESPAGVLRVEPGFIVVDDGGDVKVYPPERFEEAYPDLKVD